MTLGHWNTYKMMKTHICYRIIWIYLFSKIAAEVVCLKQVFWAMCRLWFIGYERDRNISFGSLLVRSHAKVPTEGFYDTLKNGPEIMLSIFELLQPAKALKINIFCWNLVCKPSLAPAIEPYFFGRFGHSQGGQQP